MTVVNAAARGRSLLLVVAAAAALAAAVAAAAASASTASASSASASSAAASSISCAASSSSASPYSAFVAPSTTDHRRHPAFLASSSISHSSYPCHRFRSDQRRRSAMSNRVDPPSSSARWPWPSSSSTALRTSSEQQPPPSGRRKSKKSKKRPPKSRSEKSASAASAAAAAADAELEPVAASAEAATATAPPPPPPPSKVIDEDGPTPERPPFEPEIVDSARLESDAAYDPAAHVVPHQPWRRGDTRGTHDPIDVQWRLEAEHVIEEAAREAGAYVECVTWHVTFAVVTLGNDLSNVELDTLEGRPVGVKIAVDTTRPETNVWTDGPEANGDGDDEEDPAGMPVGTYYGEEHARVGPEWDDDDDDDDDGGGTEPKYDEETGELLPKPLKDTRGEAIYTYQKERMRKLEERKTRMKMLNLPDTLTPRNIRDSAKLDYDGFQKNIDDYEAVLVEKYGDIKNMTDEELHGALQIYNAYLWHMTPDRLEEFKSYLLEKWDPVYEYEGRDRDVYDANVRADGITDDYADRLAIVADAILKALSDPDVDERIDVIDRHEIILTSANFDTRIVETQRDFDANRNKDVLVQTRDPWKSNRVIEGKLVDRNAMDVMLNVEGRLVTIPNNMVGYVYLPEKYQKARMEFEAMFNKELLDEYEDGAVAGEGDEGAWEEEDADDDDEDGEWEYEYVEEEDADDA